jgi:hypothetical protein
MVLDASFSLTLVSTVLVFIVIVLSLCIFVYLYLKRITSTGAPKRTDLKAELPLPTPPKELPRLPPDGWFD